MKSLLKGFCFLMILALPSSMQAKKPVQKWTEEKPWEWSSSPGQTLLADTINFPRLEKYEMELFKSYITQSKTK